MTSDDDDNWLRPEVLDCPDCGAKIFKVDQSPFCDSWRIYCSSCPKSVEVSFYDPVVEALQKEHPYEGPKADFFHAIEEHLNRCTCGGAFRFDAARRCYNCGCVVTDDTGTDLYRFFGLELDEDRDPTEEEQAVFDEWAARLIRTEDIWNAT